MGPSESAHLVLHATPPPSPPEGISSSASVSWVTFYPCPSKLARLSALSCLHCGSRSAPGSVCWESINGLLEFVRFSPTCTLLLFVFFSLLTYSQNTGFTLCTQTRCAFWPKLPALMSGTWTTGIWPVWLVLVSDSSTNTCIVYAKCHLKLLWSPPSDVRARKCR